MQQISASVIWDDLKPRIDALIATRISASGVRSAGASGGAVSAHALSGALHTGLLDDGQAPQFLLRSGGRSLTGDLAVDSGFTVDGVDISAHAANANAHHNAATAGDGISVVSQIVSLASSVAGGGLGYAAGVVSVGAGLGITVNSDDVALASSVAGPGLGYAAGVLSVGVANTGATGLSVEADQVRLTSSSAPGAAASVLASDATGLLTLPLFVATTSIVSPLVTATTSVTTPLVTATTNLQLSPSVDLQLYPTGDILIEDGTTLRTDSFSTLYPIEGMIIAETAVAGQYGMAIGVIEADELRVRVFVADEVRIDRGEEIWSKSYGITAADFTTPGSIGGTVTVTFESSPMIAGALFTANDWLLFRTIDIDTGVVLSAVWGQVTGYSASNVVQFWTDFLPDSAMPLNSFPKVDLGTTTQDWTFTLRSGDTSYRIPEGSLGIDYGQAGQSYIAFSVTDPIAAPYIRIRRWTGANPYTPANHDDTVYIGNLNGIANASGDRGIWTQNEAGTSWAELSDDGVILRNASIALYDGATQKVNIGSSGTDFWMGTSSSDKRLHWNGTTLAVTGQITVSSGSSGYSNMSDKPDSLADINAGERYDLQTSASVVFTETFDNGDSLSQWTNHVTGKGELSIVTLSDTVAGGNVLRVGNNSGDDQCWLFGNRKIPFDAGKTYRMRVRVRRVAGTATLYLGCAGVAANGVDWVNRNGSNSIATQHYHTAGAATPGTTWTEYVGYIRGFGATVGSGAVGTASEPGEMHPNVRYIVPILLVNGAVAGQYEFDMVTIEAVTGVWYSIDGMPARFNDSPGAAGLYLSSTEMGYWNGSAWKTWIASTGEFYFGGSSGAHLEWNGTKLRGLGTDGATEQWYADSTNGKLYAGSGSIWLDSAGEYISATLDTDKFQIPGVVYVYTAIADSLVTGSDVAWTRSGTTRARMLGGYGSWDSGNDWFGGVRFDMYGVIDTVSYSSNFIMSWDGFGMTTALGNILAFNEAGSTIESQLDVTGVLTVNSSDLILSGGNLRLQEKTTPTASSGYGALYTKTDNKLYFQDGDGTEHTVAFV